MALQGFICTFLDPAGNPIANGKLTLRLNGDAVTETGQQISAKRTTTVSLDDTGTARFNIWPNDQLTPETIYFLAVYSATGQLVWQQQSYLMTKPPYYS